MKEQTAVEWLVEQLPMRIKNSMMGEIEQAKEMEKANIIDTWYDCKMSIIDKNPTTADDYYNKTFNKSINNKG